MIRSPIFRGTVTHGKIVLDNRDRFREHLAAHEGKRIELTLRERQENRTDAQNAYYHGVVLQMISEHTGDDHDSIHEEMKKRFNGGKSTTRLPTKEFNEYVSRVKIWAAEFLGLPIPDPNQVDFEG